MIKKLKRRYLITNMALLSSTLIVCLAILFGFLYHSEVASSYTVMQEMMEEAQMPPPPDNHQPELVPNVQTDVPELELLEENGEMTMPWVIPPPFWVTMPPDWTIENPWLWTTAEPYVRDNDDHSAPYVRDDDDHHAPSETDQPVDDDRPNDGDKPHDDGDKPNGTQPPPETRPPQQQTTYREPWNPARTTGYSGTRPDRQMTTDSEHTRPNDGNSKPPRDRDEPFGGSQPPMPGKTTTTTTVIPEEPAPETTQTTQPPLVPVQEGRYIPDAFVAQIDEDGNIASYAGNDSNTSDDEDFHTVHNAMDHVKRSGHSAGTVEIGENSYRYLYKPDDSGNYRLVLLDRTLELSTISKLVFIFVLLTILGLLVMFGISVLLANWTVTPIATAWEKQKQFVADASHELKTPLAVISANTEVIMADPTQSVSGQTKWLNYIQSETMRMSKLITNLLSVARMDSKETHRQSIPPLALSEAVSNVCLVFEPIVFENGKTMNTNIQPDISFSAEEDNIKQLLSILLDNAVLHSVPEAEISVTLTEDAQGKIRLSVSNTAKDIPPEQLAHLFERFYRVDTEGSPNGSGLGLSIAKSIVNSMGGKLTVTSENRLVTFVALFSP